jgi:hypothetical protein
MANTDKPADKWVTPAKLREILKAKGRVVSRFTIDSWIRRQKIPTMEFTSGKYSQYLVDKTKVPKARGPGRPKKD